MNNKIYDLLVDKGAIMNGHFILTSGLHSNKYIEKFRVLEDPKSLEIICREMATRFDHIDIFTSAEDLSMFDDGSVDEIYACHLLGYFDLFEVKKVMKLPVITGNQNFC